jgi:sodium-type flagellar protein MotY
MAGQSVSIGRLAAETLRISIRRVAAVVLLAPGLSVASEFIPSPGRANWKTSASSLECRLSQSIPFFGEASFRQQAGRAAEFLLHSPQRIGPGQADLRVETPPWRAVREPISLGPVPVRSSSTPVQLGEQLAGRLLSALFEGLSPVFRGISANTLSGSISVGLSAVRFRPALNAFRECQEGLLPVSYADVQRTRIGYQGGAFELDHSGRYQLDLMLQHMKLAKDVTAIFVDGYSDRTGRPAQNLELSKKRAEAVMNYLIANGVPAEIITMRYHGSRYPIARGSAAAANRRVTVRLERG